MNYLCLKYHKYYTSVVYLFTIDITFILLTWKPRHHFLPQQALEMLYVWQKNVEYFIYFGAHSTYYVCILNTTYLHEPLKYKQMGYVLHLQIYSFPYQSSKPRSFIYRRLLKEDVSEGTFQVVVLGWVFHLPMIVLIPAKCMYSFLFW